MPTPPSSSSRVPPPPGSRPWVACSRVASARAFTSTATFFRRSIVAGRHETTPDAAPAALAQLRLRYRLAAAAADTYAADGFMVVVEDVAAGPLLAEYAGLFRSRPLHVVVLLPSRTAVAAREAAREQSGYERFSVEQLHDGFARETPRLGLWLDTTEQTPEETVEAVLAGSSRSLVIAP